MSKSADRLYELLPAIHRIRDAERGYPLKELLRVIAEQVNAVEENVDQLYDDWFIETASDWVAPYIADLVGYEPVHAAGDPAVAGQALNRILIPRREVANTVRFRRRRGTLAVLEELAAAVANWPARAVEFYRLLCWTQNLNHQQSDGYRARVGSLRNANELDKIGTPFDPFARTVDVRRISSRRSPGRYSIPNIGLFVWRLKAYSVTGAPAYCLDAGQNQYTFSVLGNDAPLFNRPEPESSPAGIANERNLPTRIRRRGLEADKEQYYGAEASFSIRADWNGFGMDSDIPAASVISADLTDWRYVPSTGYVAVDPVLGRIAFPPNQLPEGHVRVSYHYGFSADMGGGEYDRSRFAPAEHVIYTVGAGGGHEKIGDALRQWREDQPEKAVIEILDSAAYVEQIQITLAENQYLQLRAANRTRPLIRLLDWQTDRPDALTVKMSAGSQFVLDGLLIAGRGVSVVGGQGLKTKSEKEELVQKHTGVADENPRNPVCPAELVIRHCTLVPGWGLSSACQPASPNKESILLRNVRAQVRIESSIVGPIQVVEDEVQNDPIPVVIADSIIDAMDGEREALIGPGARHAHVDLTVRRSTVFGIVQVHAISLAENSIFNHCLHVARRQIGCMRFCYVPPGCRTPKRFRCQPDLVEERVRDDLAGVAPEVIKAEQAREAERVRPRYTDRFYGRPAYCQLASYCADEIKRGADDASEMGVFHDLFQPQRMANLRARLESYTPSAMDSGVILAN